jgi:hypothetical protein
MIRFHFPVINYLWENALNKSFATWPGPDEDYNLKRMIRYI